MKFLLSIFLLSIITFTQAKVVPALNAPVIDQPDIIDWGTEKKINYILKKFNKDTGIQFQVFITNSLEGEIIEDYTIKAVDEWKLGGEKDDKAALLFIALNDRKMRLEVSDGLEGDITDVEAGRIIHSLVPYFKARQYSSGIVIALKQMALLTGNDLKETNIVKTKKIKSKTNGIFIAIFFILYFILMIFGKRRSSFWYIGGSRHSSGGGFSSGGFGSGGGGWSGGGGSFGGGGASGSW
tara:strand:- start:4936 stop:5652 length:717 start_codon:yes stop_codon:yes gene_type:complete